MSAQEELQVEQEQGTAITIDYSEKFNSLEAALERIEERIESIGSESYFESNGIPLIEGNSNLSDILAALFFIIITLGLIFGAVVFQHFRGK